MDSKVYAEILLNGVFTLDQIKEAFWREFHESGEVWFSNIGIPEAANACTEEIWEEFMQELIESV